jgi:hypothetical protein
MITRAPRRGARPRRPALLAALAAAGALAGAFAGPDPAATTGAGAAATAGQPPHGTGQPPAAAEQALAAAERPPVIAGQPPALAERLNVREVELILEAPPVLLGIRDLRLHNFDLLDIPGGAGVRLPLPARRGLADLGPGDLLLFEDGKARPILRLEPLRAGAAHPWTLRIYFDLVLARPRTVFEAALALARQAGRLAELGKVEIVVADPQPRLLPIGSRDALAIEDALAAIAAQAGRDPLARPFTRIPAPTPASLRRQCDRLLTSLATSQVAGPHALLLVADPPLLTAAELQRLSAVASSTAAPAAAPAAATAAIAVIASTAAPVDARSAAGPASPVMDTDPAARAAAPTPAAISGPGGDPATLLGDTARMLAAYGWLTIALPVHRLAGEREALPEDDNSRFRRQWWADKDTRAGIPFLPLIRFIVDKLRARRPPPRPDKELVAPQIDMEYASLATLVRPGAGSVVTTPEQLAGMLHALGARWHLWYQADATPAGRERPVAVSMAGNALEVRAPRWVRSSTPEHLAAARLRRLLDGDDLAGALPISATMLAPPPAPTGLASGSETAGAGAAGEAPEPLVLLAQASPAVAADPASAGPVRVSFAWSDAAGKVEVKHRLLDAGQADAWLRRRTLRLTAPPPAAGRSRVALMVEDLATELWGATVVPNLLPSEGETSDGKGALRRPSGSSSERRGPKLP